MSDRLSYEPDAQTGQPVTELADGSVDNAEFQRVDGVTAPIQGQIDGKQAADTDLTAVAGLAALEGLYRKTGAGTAVLIKTNLAAAVDPAVIDDGAAGYSVGSLWLNTTAQRAFICLSSANGAAAWVCIGDVNLSAAEIADLAAVTGQELRVQTTIAMAAVRTLNATAIEIAPAPGAGKYIEPVSLHVWLNYGTAVYDAVAAGDDLVAKFTDKNGVAITGTIAGAGFGDATADAFRRVGPLVTALTPVENAKAVLHLLQGEWYVAAGNSPLKIEFRYRVRNYNW